MAGTSPGTGKGLWHGRRRRVGALPVHPRAQPALASPGCRSAGVLVPNRMLAPCRCCPRYTSRWLFTAPLLGDQPVFILVIWQRHSGTDESGAGRSCFATFPLPHRRGFSQDRLSSRCPCCLPWGAPGPWDGGRDLWDGKWALGWGNDPWDGGMMPEMGKRSLG